MCGFFSAWACGSQNRAWTRKSSVGDTESSLDTSCRRQVMKVPPSAIMTAHSRHCLPKSSFPPDWPRLRDRARSSIRQDRCSDALRRLRLSGVVRERRVGSGPSCAADIGSGGTEPTTDARAICLQVPRDGGSGDRKCDPRCLSSAEFRSATPDVRHGRFTGELFQEGKRRDLRASAAMACPAVSDSRPVHLFETGDLQGPGQERLARRP